MQKKFKIGISFLLFLLLIGLFFANQKITYHYENYIQKNLPLWIAKATKGKYQITYGRISVNAFTRGVIVHNVHIFLTPNYPKQGTINFEVNAPVVRLSVVRLLKLDAGKIFKCSGITIENPIIKIQSFPPAVDSFKIPNTLATPNNIWTKNANSLVQLITPSIAIINPIIDYQYLGTENKYAINAQGGLITLKDCEYKPFEKHDSTWFYYAHEATLELKNCTYNTPNNFYNFKMSTVYFDSKKQNLVLQNLTIKPAISPTKIYEKVGHQTNIYTAEMPSVVVCGLDWEHWIRNHELVADKIDFDSTLLSIYLSRIPPPNIKNRMGNAPPQLLQKIKMPISVNSVNFKNTQLGYTEESRKTYQPATIFFSDLKSTIAPISNHANKPLCSATLQGLFMNRANVKALFQFPMNKTDGSFSLKAQIQNVDAEQLSAQAKNWALAEITSLLVDQVDFEMKGNEDTADVKMGMAYKNLKIKIFKVDSNTHEMTDRRWVSLFANNVMLYPKNPMNGDTLRTVNFGVDRDTTKPFFTFLWNGLYGGILGSVSRTDDLAQIVKLKLKNKNKREKTHFFSVFRKKKN